VGDNPALRTNLQKCLIGGDLSVLALRGVGDRAASVSGGVRAPRSPHHSVSEGLESCGWREQNTVRWQSYVADSKRRYGYWSLKQTRRSTSRTVEGETGASSWTSCCVHAAAFPNRPAGDRTGLAIGVGLMTAKDPAEKPTNIAGAAPSPQTNHERAWRCERQKPNKTGGRTNSCSEPQTGVGDGLREAL